MVYRYFFRTKRVSPADMPKNPTKIDIFDFPVYSHEFERDVWGYAEYDHPIQLCDIYKHDLMCSSVNIIPFIRKW